MAIVKCVGGFRMLLFSQVGTVAFVDEATVTLLVLACSILAEERSQRSSTTTAVKISRMIRLQRSGPALAFGESQAADHNPTCTLHRRTLFV
jgi:hypothetical protein